MSAGRREDTIYFASFKLFFSSCVRNGLLIGSVAVISVLFAVQADAQLDDSIIDGAIASSYKVQDHERVLKYWRVPPHASGEIRSYTLTFFGSHLAFLDGWNVLGSKIWRSRPLPLTDCMVKGGEESPITLTSFGTDGVFLSVKGCERAAGAYIRAPDGMMISFQPVYPVYSFLALPATGQQGTLDYGSYLQENWLKTPPTDTVGTPLPSPSIFAVKMDTPPTPSAMSTAISVARDNLHDKRGSPVDARAKLNSSLMEIDWRTAGLSTEDLNDLGYILQQSGESYQGTKGCSDLDDALLVLQEVLQRDPKRTVAYLNLADTYTTSANANCSNSRSVRTLWANDYYRQYCSMLGSRNVPAYTARRIAREIGVARLDRESCTPQYTAVESVRNRDLEGLEATLSNPSINPSIVGPDGFTALYVSLNAKLPEFSRALLVHKASPDLSGSDPSLDPPLTLALRNYDVETVQLLVKQGAKADLPRRSKAYIDPPLYTAAGLSPDDDNQHAKKIAMLSAILAAKPSLEVPNINGQTALMGAVLSEDPEAVDLLLSAGSYVNASSDRKSTSLSMIPAHDANNSTAICKSLLKAGANVNQQGYQDETPLMHVLGVPGNKGPAVTQVLEELLRHGADPNLPSGNGQTPLELAVGRGNLEAVRLLLKFKARINSANAGKSQDVFQILEEKKSVFAEYEKDNNPVHRAQWNEWLEMEKLLQSAK